MKKALLIGIALLIGVASSAQDWANFGKYGKDNKSVTKKPIAVFMGDSITEGWMEKDPDFFISNNYLGRGISGQTTSQMLVRFRKDVLELSPKYVVILAGTNDIAKNGGDISVENTFGNIKSMCEIAKANKVKPVICSILPCKGYLWRPEVTDAGDQIVRLNAMLKEYAGKNRIVYVDYHSVMKDAENGLPEDLSYDGCHATLKGYKVMEDIVLKVLK